MHLWVYLPGLRTTFKAHLMPDDGPGHDARIHYALCSLASQNSLYCFSSGPSSRMEQEQHPDVYCSESLLPCKYTSPLYELLVHSVCLPVQADKKFPHL